MAFGRKREIDSLNNANQFLQTENQRLQTEREQLGPYDAVARDLYDTVQAQAALTEDPEQAYANAYESVRQDLFEQRREARRLAIVAEHQPVWEKEIDDDIIRTKGAAMVAEARQKFFDTQAESYRRTAEPRISAEIERITQDQLIAEFDEATRTRLRAHADEKALKDAEYQQRLERIRDRSERHGQLSVDWLDASEVITIDFCAVGTATDEMPQKRQNGHYGATVERTLKLNVLNPETGMVLVLDDSWRKDEDDLRANHAIEDNTPLTIGTLRIDDEGMRVEAEIHRGGLLYMMAPHERNVSHPFEVSRVWLRDDCIL